MRDLEPMSGNARSSALREALDHRIYLLRGQKVMLNSDLALLYQVPPRVLMQAVKRSIERFPGDFMFQLTPREFKNVKSQHLTSSWGSARKPPLAFTGWGVAMLSGVLRSRRAVSVNSEIIRTFVRLRELHAFQGTFVHNPAAWNGNYDVRIKVVFDVMRAMMNPPNQSVEALVSNTITPSSRTIETPA